MFNRTHWPKHNLILDIFMINLDTNFISVVQPLWRKWMDTANMIGIFLSPRNITLSKIVWSYQKDILTINLDTKFHFSMCDICGENERKLLVDRANERRTAVKQYTIPSLKGTSISSTGLIYIIFIIQMHTRLMVNW